MYKYVPHTELDIKEMLDTIGVNSVDDLFIDIPDSVKFKNDYNLENGLSELEVYGRINSISHKNRVDMTPFVGAGSYDHYIPSIIKHIAGRSEFATAYTPYQPEVSQGTLQYIFEFQTMMCNLLDMEVSNASMYDAFTAAAEACMMANNATRRNKVLISSSANPSYINVIKTYARFRGFEVELIDSKNGLTDLESIKDSLDKTISGVFIQSPNYNGLIEDPSSIVEHLHSNKSLLIMGVNPLMQTIVKTPGEIGANIVVGDAQPMGIPMSYGGPYLGFMLTSKKLMRKMPGRICGETKDVDGKRAFVLTLQAREQHIRREKANSNICSNQSLNVLGATIFMSTMGKGGMTEMATQNYQKSHYVYDLVTKLDKFERVYEGDFFNEFVVKSAVPYEEVKDKLESNNIIPGIHLGDNLILFCVTEKRTKSEIETFMRALGEL
ncbi:aminomethyl-transferring glycine dehydrogenase subunit GcvPA [Mycoplasmatota bacterium WC44]